MQFPLKPCKTGEQWTVAKNILLPVCQYVSHHGQTEKLPACLPQKSHLENIKYFFLLSEKQFFPQ
jgi:hypothetical protein